MMQEIKRPEWVNKLLATCPPAHKGVHAWLFATARQLHGYYAQDEVIETLLSEATQSCGRELQCHEIPDAVRNSRPQPVDENAPARLIRPKLAPNADMIRKAIAVPRSVAELEAMSPRRWGDGEAHTEEIIDVLFPGNPLLCAGPKSTYMLTGPREGWRGRLQRQQLIVPHPMTSIRGLNKAGKSSRRCLNNTGPRRFAVVEFDTGSPDNQTTLLLHLARLAPLVLVVHSGNKSLHGWFFRGNATDEALEKFYEYAVALGADPATRTLCQPVRMPDGQRDNGNRQRVLFFNPKPIK
jgi:hypothetical protein